MKLHVRPLEKITDDYSLAWHRREARHAANMVYLRRKLVWIACNEDWGAYLAYKHSGSSGLEQWLNTTQEERSQAMLDVDEVDDHADLLDTQECARW